MKRTRSRKSNPYFNPEYRLAWGGYAGKKMKDIPAKYFLVDIYKQDWARGQILEWIETTMTDLEERRVKERRNGYAREYKRNNYYK